MARRSTGGRAIFFVGDAGTGKSELHRVLKAILMRGLISTTNATSAGLYQLVGHDSLPIAIDELEGEDAPGQSQQIIKMARDAASGSVRIRGGANHQGVEFAARSTFLFSAINPPPLPPASLRPGDDPDAAAQKDRRRAAGDRGGRDDRAAAAAAHGRRLARFPAAATTAIAWRCARTATTSAARTRSARSSRPRTRCSATRAWRRLRLEYENLNEWGSRLAAENTPETANRRPTGRGASRSC
jgi:DNA replicative helicase MCM subunit Mcm2 (Cdc46/Mcm family)